MDRRSFLGLILASAVAPAIVRASSLMQLPVRRLWTHPEGGLVAIDDFVANPANWGMLRFYDGVPDDPAANLLGEMPIENWSPAEFGSIQARTPGLMTWQRSGVASMYAIERASDGERIITGTVGDSTFGQDDSMLLSSRHVALGQVLALNQPPSYSLGESLGGILLSEEVRNRMLDSIVGLPEAVKGG